MVLRSLKCIFGAVPILFFVTIVTAGPVRAEPRKSTGVLDFERVTGLSDAQAPLPHDTLLLTASIPFNGQFGTGEAYVYLSDSHSTLTNPVIVVEGFDLNNDMNWDELYQLLNQEGLIESIRSIGFDAVVLNFTESTDYLQKNALVVVELLEQIQAAIGPSADFVLAGASMGGLCARYALCYMETNGPAHRVRTFISFDSPHTGANIPLGVQYWLDFFSGLSDDAAYNLSRLDTPAARQMLVYHHTDPPGATGQSDPLRASWESDLAALGDWPTLPRLVSVVNGSGYGTTQGYAAGAQLIDYEYADFLTTIRGNVWAVPDQTSRMILDGYIRLLIIPVSQTVTVSGTRPFDNAPGGFRNTLADLDSSAAPYGDITALHPSHCFVPVTSALALDTQDLFYDVAGDPDLVSHTPFDAVYVPLDNQEHGTITAESKQWFLTEIKRAATAIAPPGLASGPNISLHQNTPNPFNPATTIRFTVPQAREVRLSVYDTAGRLVVVLLDGYAGAGTTRIIWDGRNHSGRPVASGVYFYRLTADGFSSTHKMLLIK
jgi:hypothetical protein